MSKEWWVTEMPSIQIGLDQKSEKKKLKALLNFLQETHMKCVTVFEISLQEM